ncbi:MAG: AAA family ATPase [Snowella sp.]|nr:AAA family ATPase [Snowella sp.]
MADSYSEPITEEIEESGTTPKKGFNIRPFIRMAIRKSWLITLITTITGLGGLTLSFFKPTTYKGNFYLLVEPITAAAKLTDPTTLTRTEGIPQREDFMALDYPTNLAFLQSPGMTYRIAQDVHNKLARQTVPAIWKDLRENFKVEWIRSASGQDATKIFEVSYQGENAKEVETVLQVAARTFVKYSAEDRQTSIKAGVKFIDRQLPALQQNLNVLKQKQKLIRERYELVDPATKNEALLVQLNDLSVQRLTLKQQLSSQMELYRSLQGNLKIDSNQAIAAAVLNQDQERLGLIKKIQEVDTQIASAEALVTPDNPQLINLRMQRENFQRLLTQRTQMLLSSIHSSVAPNSPILDFQDPTRIKLTEQLIDAQNQVNSIQAQSQLLETKIKQIEKLIRVLPDVINQFNTIARDIRLTEEIVDKLLLQRENLKVEAAQELPWQLISKPQIPLDEYGNPVGEPPSRQKLLIAGVAGGLFISLTIIFLWERRKNIFYCAEDIQDILGIPLIGLIPNVVSSSASFQKSVVNLPLLEETEEKNAVSSELSVPESLAESSTQANRENEFLLFLDIFDEIYSELSFFYRQPALRSLVISAIQVGDGQSTIALNLAIAASQQSKKVLLVDANWQNSPIYPWLNLQNEKGLSNLLQQEISLESVLQVSPDYPNLSLLSSGPKLSTKHLWSNHFQYCMSEFQANYDLVIYDLPPFLDNTDIYFISTYTDGLIFTIGVKKTPQTLAKEAVKKAQELRLPVLGTFANFS